VPAHAQEVNQVIEPGQQGIAGPAAGDTDGERPVHLATAEGRGGIVEEYNGWLSLLVERNGSDLHVKVGTPPKVRQSGALLPLDREPLSHDEMEAIGTAIVPHERVERFEVAGEVDFAYSLPGVGRFRVNVFRQRGSVSAVFRTLRFGGPGFDEMGLPEVIRQLADEQRGLVLVTGPTGSGKTTTLAAMIEHLNHTRQSHIVTIEDPIEELIRDDDASNNQRELGTDTESFLSALRAALRQDPDVILIGEMRDTETVRTSLQAAETGHLVLSTLHTVDATETVNRVVDFFPPEQQGQVRLTLAGALKGIICQRLVPARDGGMVPCHEILVNTGRVAERISDADKTAEIHDVIAEGGYYGMCTFDQSLLQLVKDEKVTVEAALSASSNPHDFTLQLQQARIALPS
jgi:twitching motility protein PilT